MGLPDRANCEPSTLKGPASPQPSPPRRGREGVWPARRRLRRFPALVDEPALVLPDRELDGNPELVAEADDDVADPDGEGSSSISGSIRRSWRSPSRLSGSDVASTIWATSRATWCFLTRRRDVLDRLIALLGMALLGTLRHGRRRRRRRRHNVKTIAQKSQRAMSNAGQIASATKHVYAHKNITKAVQQTRSVPPAASPKAKRCATASSSNRPDIST